jgi:thymidylate synthase (FAD)
MNVTLLTHTPEPEKIVAAAARLCYSSSEIGEIMDNFTDEKIERFIAKLKDLGHESPLEHITFVFGIEGISRACSHQLVRHRIASYSQKSQRYVNESNFDYVVPPAVQKNPELLDYYKHMMFQINEFYEDLKAEGLEAEDARFILPNATKTSLIVTMNVRTLLNFFKLRDCNRAQWEIREVAREMMKICKEVAPLLFKDAGAACRSGKCSEGAMSCGNPLN